MHPDFIDTLYKTTLLTDLPASNELKLFISIRKTETGVDVTFNLFYCIIYTRTKKERQVDKICNIIILLLGLE